jgi:hypothetical protein
MWTTIPFSSIQRPRRVHSIAKKFLCDDVCGCWRSEYSIFPKTTGLLAFVPIVVSVLVLVLVLVLVSIFVRFFGRFFVIGLDKVGNIGVERNLLRNSRSICCILPELADPRPWGGLHPARVGHIFFVCIFAFEGFSSRQVSFIVARIRWRLFISTFHARIVAMKKGAILLDGQLISHFSAWYNECSC